MFEDITKKEIITEMKIDHRSVYSKDERINNVLKYLKETHTVLKYLKEEDYDFVSELEDMISYIKYGYRIL